MVAEYSDPNPFKVLHAGHLYTSVVGDAIANLLEHAGANVHRVNFGGDVGLHVAKTLWAMERDLKGDLPQKFNSQPIEERAEWMAKCYVVGAQAYEDDETARASITSFNKQVYEIHAKEDYTSYIAQIYWMCREWSYEYFRKFYARLGIQFEKFYPESEVANAGLTIVKEQLANKVYEQSDGAVIFNGEKYGLHTRVFINSEGLPTYEAKDVGLIIKKYEDYHFDKSIVITGNEQAQYMAVVLKSVEQFAPELAKATTHLTHGLVKLAGGEKMSSRKGNFLRATDVLDAAVAANKKLTGKDNEQTVLGAVKYAFLKNRMGGDIIYDPEESVSLEGNSGPYLQYAHARARSILAKSKTTDQPIENLEAGERSLVRKISEYPEMVDRAVAELMPHYICTYLYELAQTFNRFYEHSRVIGDVRQATRLILVDRYADTLKSGLELLGIASPEHI
jgi:arginyl-tRNA synthetase